MNIQNEVQKIHAKYGVTEKANYQIQLLCEKYADEYHQSKLKNNGGLCDVTPRFLKTKYSLEELDQYIMELSARTDRHIHRGKLEDIEKLIRWRKRYDALNGA